MILGDSRNVIAELVVLNLAGVVGCSLYGQHLSGWDTVSDMITASTPLRNAFVAYLVFSAMAILVCVDIFCERLKHNKLLVRALQLLYVVFISTYIGFGVISTDADTDTHTLLATIAFTSLITMSALLMYWQWSKITPSRAMSVLAFAGALLGAFMWVATEMYYWEYVLIIALHAHWLTLARVNGPDHGLEHWQCRVELVVKPHSELRL